MNYQQLVETYFERSNALTWFWTVYILVIGGILAFLHFRDHRDFPRVMLITIFYVAFAYKNLGAIEDTIRQRDAVLSAIKAYTPSETADVKLVHERLEPTLQPSTISDTRYFHLACGLLSVAAIWVREWRRPRLPLAAP